MSTGGGGGGGTPVTSISAEIELREGDLEARLRAIEARMKAVAAEFAKGDTSIGAYAGEMRQLGAEARALEGHLQKARAAGGSFTMGANELARSSRNSGLAVLELSRGVEDFSVAGVRGALNNLPLLLQSLGVGAGLTGVASLAAVAASVLYNNWDQVAELWGQGGTKTQAEEMEALAEKTAKTAEETRKLAAWEEKRAQIESLKGGQPAAETEAQRAVQAAIDESGGQQAMAGKLAGTFGVDKSGLAPSLPGYEEFQEAEAKATNLRGLLDDAGLMGEDAMVIAGQLATAEKQMREARQRNEAARTKQANEVLRQAKFDRPGGIDALVRRMEANPAVFEPATISRFRAATPEAREQREALFQQGQRGEQFAKEQEAEREQRRKEEAEYIAEDQAESDRRVDKRKQAREKAALEAETEREQLVESQAKTFLGGEAHQIEALEHELTPGDVRGRLEAAGEPRAAEIADDVYMSIMQQMEEKVGARALEKGITTGEAREELIEEAEEPARKAQEEQGSLMRELMKAQAELTRPKGIEVMDAASVHEKIQVAGQGEDQKQTQALEKVRDILERIHQHIQRNGGPATLG